MKDLKNIQKLIQEIILEMLLNEAVPIPPMLQQSLQQQKAILQQMLGGNIQKGIEIKGSPIVNAYIQNVVKQGIRDPQQILNGFDQYFISQQGNDIVNQLAKKNIVAPPTNLGKGKAVPTFSNQTTVNKTDPFGIKQREDEKAAIARHKQNLASIRKADEKADEFDKDFQNRQAKTIAAKPRAALKEHIIKVIIDNLIKLDKQKENRRI